MSNNTGLQALGFNVLLEMPEKKEKTKGGVYLPDKAQETEALLARVGKILSMGCNAFMDAYGEIDKNKPGIGDWVYINAHAGIDIKRNNRLYRMVSSDEVRAVLTIEPEEFL